MSRFPKKFSPGGAICQQSVQILAVAALDDLVVRLVKAAKLKMSAGFLDWVADEATPLVESRVERFFGNERFIASLSVGDPGVAMSLWVRHWIAPQITANFGQLASHVADFADSGLAALPDGPARPAPAATPGRGLPRPPQILQLQA